MYNPFHPPPAPPGFGENTIVPENQSSWLSKLLFVWLNPMLNVGYTRPLQKDDLWQLPENLLTAQLSAELERNFFARVAPEKRPRIYRETDQLKDDISESLKPTSSSKSSQGDVEKQSPNDTDASESHKTSSAAKAKEDSKYDGSLLRALNTTFFWRWWIAGALKLASDTLKTTTPLITQLLLTWLTEAYVYQKLSDAQKASGTIGKPRGIGYGIGLAFGIFVMQEVASLLSNHFMMIAMSIGMRSRTATTGAIFRKSLRLSGRARLDHSVGQITTMISTDTARLERAAMLAHGGWTGLIQIVICLGLLISTLGYSALVGLAVLILGTPVQAICVKIMFAERKKGVKFTDSRIRLTTEVLGGIRLIKFFGWEPFYTEQVSKYRTLEVATIKNMAIARSGLIGMVYFVPVAATILSFITYSLTGHELNIAIIFTSLQYFNILRMPLLFFPIIIASTTDAVVALARIGKFLSAEELAEPFLVDEESKNAIEVDGTFTWETAGKPTPENLAHTKKGHQSKDDSSKITPESTTIKASRWKRKSAAPVDLPLSTVQNVNKDKRKSEVPSEEVPFELKDLKLKVPKGSFVAIVGRVGTGKSSVMQALIGEMRRVTGTVVFGGSVAYVPQTAWIRNATLRENILFGSEDDEARFRTVIRACSLLHDIEMLPQGEDTEIGEKGINLSGGQKARVSLGRAAYSHADIVLLDDCLSAVDAYVGKSLLENCILNGPLAERTRVLVTHALHVLDRTDYIYVMGDHGRIIEEGTYRDLIRDSVVFAKLIEEYGAIEEDDKIKTDMTPVLADSNADPHVKRDTVALMQVEERNTGAVTWTTYSRYLKYAGGLFWAPVILSLLILVQGAQVANNIFLGLWTSQSVAGFSTAAYMAVYSALGVASAIFALFSSISFSLAALSASLNIYKAALERVLRSPASFFDTTPTGRILSRLSKDFDTLDAELAMILFQFLSTFMTVLGTVVLVFYTFPYLGTIFIPLTGMYLFVASYYRRTSVETKRLDSIMRSTLYASYSETLTGLSTVRAYRDQERSIRDADLGMDLENRAYYITVAIQQWLGVRLDFFGNILVLGIGLFAAGFRTTVDPSKIGVVLSYTLSITQTFSLMVSQFAQNEQNMNAAERVLVYTDLIGEGSLGPVEEPQQSWPQHGAIKFTDVELVYRDGLPKVLKGVTFDVDGGEKIGIVGRTGAGKSSLMQALFRIVELHAGKIEIDGQDISKIGLDTLRHRLALVPQDSTLFLGTLRDNLDPQGSRTDAELIETLQRAWLLPKNGDIDAAAEAKFSLDSAVGDDGGNFSAGEKQLLALCRALVKNSRIIVLDEATSSVDVETDGLIQKTIQTEFSKSTLLCIAHRLNTVVYMDRVMVMDDGKVAEFDTVLNLFDREDSIFRSLCDDAGLSRQDIQRIRQESGQVSSD